MPRTARSCSGGYTYHVLNRGNAWATVFHKPDDYDAFLDVMAEASIRSQMRILAYCLRRGDIANSPGGLDNLGKGTSLIRPVVWIIWGMACLFNVVNECAMPRTARSCSGGYTNHDLRSV